MNLTSEKQKRNRSARMELGVSGMGRILIGTSSWTDHEGFYPAGISTRERLPFYARYFPIVEVNSTYYAIPAKRVVQGWVERTPTDFIFDIKPPRQLTATPETPGGEAPRPDADLAARFLDALEPLITAGKLGAITFQFPPSYRNTEEHQEYLRLLPELLPGVPISVEFRRRDWLDARHAPQTFQLLREAGLAYTMVDEPQVGIGCVPPIYAVTNPELAIIRFHGRNAETWYRFTGKTGERFNWEYRPEELAEWKPKIERAAQDARVVHVFFNTNYGNQGPRNALLLMDLLGIAHPPLPL